MIAVSRADVSMTVAALLLALVFTGLASVGAGAADDSVQGIGEAKRQLERGRYDEAERLTRLGLEAAVAGCGEESAEAAAWMPLLVEVLFRKGLIDEAHRVGQRNLEILQQLHGTDHPDTAEALAGLDGKTIVLTGALSPARFRTTDAIFNVGMAVAAVQVSEPGVYIAMSGQVFAAGEVRKNRDQNRFEAV